MRSFGRGPVQGASHRKEPMLRPALGMWGRGGWAQGGGGTWWKGLPTGLGRGMADELAGGRLLSERCKSLGFSHRCPS